MKKRISIALATIVLVLLMVGLIALRPPAPRNFEDADFASIVSIAPLAEALTFARTTIDGEIHLLAVTGYENEQVTVVDLTLAVDDTVDDPIDLFGQLGYEQLQQTIESAADDSLITVDVAELIIPVNLTDAHVAAGTNFTAHAEESDVVDGPFLFAKLVEPTQSGSMVKVGDALLDYEVELAFVTLSDVSLPNVPENMGLILTNDFTDRATLLRHLNPEDVTSGEGFTTGKSAPGYLPVGDLFVIPRDLRSFVEPIEIQLAVNGQLRQSAPMSLAIWDIDELLQQIKIREQTRWLHNGQEIGLPIKSGSLPARTLILSGTPDGTAFSGISNRDIATGVWSWASGGWSVSITDNIIEGYIESGDSRPAFLRAGDQVQIRADRMGLIHTKIGE